MTTFNVIISEMGGAHSLVLKSITNLTANDAGELVCEVAPTVSSNIQLDLQRVSQAGKTTSIFKFRGTRKD